MLCPNCRAAIGDTEAFCPHCGARMAVQPVVQSAVPKKKSNVAVFVIAAMLMICVGVVLIFALSSKGKTDGAPPENAPSQEVAADTKKREPKKSDEKSAREPKQTQRDTGPSASEPPTQTPEPEPAATPSETPAPEPVYLPPAFIAAAASGYTPATTRGSYEPQLVLDGKPDTAWNVPDSDAEDAWIILIADAEQYVQGIRILNGFTLYSEERGMWVYGGNHRAKDITISFSDGTSFRYTLDDAFDGDNYIYQDIPLSEPVLTAYIKITIDSIYPGDRWNDICISEIEVY